MTWDSETRHAASPFVLDKCAHEKQSLALTLLGNIGKAFSNDLSVSAYVSNKQAIIRANLKAMDFAGIEEMSSAMKKGDSLYWYVARRGRKVEEGWVIVTSDGKVRARFPEIFGTD